MAGQRILVVDDDARTVEVVRMYLERDGYRVYPAYNGREALDLSRRLRPDLIILDLMLPGMNGLAVCRTLRQESDVPVIMLTARVTESDKLIGLETGADDYVTKPFSPRELAARVRTVLRRARAADGDEATHIKVGDLCIDLFAHEVRRGDRPLQLTPSEFRLLAVLARQPGRAFTRVELIEQAFGYEFDAMERTVDMHILNLRRKLGGGPAKDRYIQTVAGVGYRFNAEVQDG